MPYVAGFVCQLKHIATTPQVGQLLTEEAAESRSWCIWEPRSPDAMSD